MYLRFARRIKNGKEHRYWSIVESKRCAGGKVAQRPVLYLGEINDSQHADWCRVIETLDADNQRYRQLALFPADRSVPVQDKTQWPGFADNGNDILGLARNLGEVFGVFGVFAPTNDGFFVNYLNDNSANFDGLARLEHLIRQ